MSIPRGDDQYLYAVLGFVSGLVLLPAVVTLAFLSSTPFQTSITGLLVIDFGITLLLLRRLQKSKRLPSAKTLLLLVFTTCCCLLAWMNGSFIELLADAWWHMEKASTILYSKEFGVVLEKPVTEFSGFNPKDWVGWFFGVESINYRMQALLAWLLDIPIIESWTASSVIVATMIGLSFALLVYSLGLNIHTAALCFLFWLILMGGLNTGMRLAAWPAGMGYVFLNIGLIACYQLFKSYRSSIGWGLFFLSLSGAAAFHIGEAFLISLGFAFVLLIRLLLVDFSWIKSSIFAALIIITLVVLSLVDVAFIAAVEDFAYWITAGFVFYLWSIGLLIKLSRNQARPWVIILIGLMALGALILLIDWQHVLLLFQPYITPAPDGYSAHFPKPVTAFDVEGLYLPKWEHQLRASLLWSGIASIPLAVWLCFQRPTKLSFYLATLLFIPVLILISPHLFSSMMLLMPGHGVYRTQFLMPVAIVLGVCCATGFEVVFSRNRLNLPIPSVFDFSQLGLVFRRAILAVLIISVIYVGYFFLARVMLGFSAHYVLPGAAEVLIIIGCLILLFRVSLVKVVAAAVVVISVAAMLPDLLFRMGVINERPWAIYSNSDFHWRFGNRSNAIVDHTSWRYQDDLKVIRGLVSEQPQAGFISDVATSYYIAAASMLKPLVQQQHHATREGEQFRKWFTRLCNGEITGQSFQHLIANYNKNTDHELIQFLIINHDTRNYTAEFNGTSCVGNEEGIPSRLEAFSERLYDGQYLSLWRLSE